MPQNQLICLSDVQINDISIKNSVAQPYTFAPPESIVDNMIPSAFAAIVFDGLVLLTARPLACRAGQPENVPVHPRKTRITRALDKPVDGAILISVISVVRGWSNGRLM